MTTEKIAKEFENLRISVLNQTEEYEEKKFPIEKLFFSL